LVSTEAALHTGIVALIVENKTKNGKQAQKDAKYIKKNTSQ